MLRLDGSTFVDLPSDHLESDQACTVLLLDYPTHPGLLCLSIYGRLAQKQTA